MVEVVDGLNSNIGLAGARRSHDHREARLHARPNGLDLAWGEGHAVARLAEAAEVARQPGWAVDSEQVPRHADSHGSVALHLKDWLCLRFGLRRKGTLGLGGKLRWFLLLFHGSTGFNMSCGIFVKWQEG